MNETPNSQIHSAIPPGPKRHYCFGNLPLHTTSFILSLVLTVLWSGVFISELRSHGAGIGQFLFFSFILGCLLLLVYGNRSNRIVYYYPVIYLLRPVLLAVVIYGAYELHELSFNVHSTHLGVGILNLLMCCGGLYICNLFAADTLYIAEAVNQPALPSFSIHFDNLKNRLTSNIAQNN
ncbi:hypothetical protein M3Y97_00021300 [Aphelenchoides bicaudatus]|nr:hypothetical protein M3Y97_00021300 [Aphelenchoides bicaudatus]